MATQEPPLPERVERSNRGHDEAKVLVWDEVFDLRGRSSCPVERSLGDTLPVCVLEDAARDTPSGLHPAADRETVTRLLDAAQGELQQQTAALLACQGRELAACGSFLAGHYRHLPRRKLALNATQSGRAACTQLAPRALARRTVQRRVRRGPLRASRARPPKSGRAGAFRRSGGARHPKKPSARRLAGGFRPAVGFRPPPRNPPGAVASQGRRRRPPGGVARRSPCRV